MAHHNIVFPEKYSRGSESMALDFTKIIKHPSGYEQRVQKRSIQSWRFSLQHLVKTEEAAEELTNFFMARGWRANSFDFKDWSRFEVIGGSLGVGDGATTDFQARRDISDVGSPNTFENIYRVRAGSYTVYVNGAPVTVNAVTADGKFQLDAAPGVGLAVTADFEHDYAVRFETRQMGQLYTSVNTRDFRNIVLDTIHPAELV